MLLHALLRARRYCMSRRPLIGVPQSADPREVNCRIVGAETAHSVAISHASATAARTSLFAVRSLHWPPVRSRVPFGSCNPKGLPSSRRRECFNLVSNFAETMGSLANSGSCRSIATPACSIPSCVDSRKSGHENFSLPVIELGAAGFPTRSAPS